MSISVHITHEAIQKIGGIHAVVEGLITSSAHQKKFTHTLLYTPLFEHEVPLKKRLGEDAEVLYSSLDHYDAAKWSLLFAPIEKMNSAHIIYGKKTFLGNLGKKITVDIIAVDVWPMRISMVDAFKFKLWKSFHIESNLYTHDRDYEQYLRIGILLRDLTESLYGKKEPCVLFSHEYMGMCAALACEIYKKNGERPGDQTVFYAHEVSTARNIVENIPGHDLAFYNLLQLDLDERISLEEEFSSQKNYSRNELIKCAAHLDYIFAVSDLIKDEFIYLCPKVPQDKIKVVYNGIPHRSISYAQKRQSYNLVGNYCETLFNYRPDYIFTHVTRLVISKGLWRDVRLLYHLDAMLAAKKKKAVFILLSTLIGTGRPPEEIQKMEDAYGWPVKHQVGWPDLVDTEVDIYRSIELFNARSKVIKGVFLNQFGFDRLGCGQRMPEGMSLEILRQSSDLEFGMSIYEPFGIAQLETLPYGGLPLISSVCGSASLLRSYMKKGDFIEIDFTKIPIAFKNNFRTKSDYKNINVDMRNLIETEICKESAPHILKHLPKTQTQKQSLFTDIQKRSEILDWEHIASRALKNLR